MNIFTVTIVKLIEIYRFLISPLFGHSCRYLPTCSEYSIDALKTFGFFKGIFLSLKRILSCHPWAKGGLDPIKKEIRDKK
jgi:hypothetical protein